MVKGCLRHGFESLRFIICVLMCPLVGVVGRVHGRTVMCWNVGSHRRGLRSVRWTGCMLRPREVRDEVEHSDTGRSERRIRRSLPIASGLCFARNDSHRGARDARRGHLRIRCGGQQFRTGRFARRSHRGLTRLGRFLSEARLTEFF